MNSDSELFQPESIQSYRDVALFCIEKLEANNYEAYVVGGTVRDIFLGREISDLDLATSAQPQEVHEVFSTFRVLDTGIRHGTVTLLIPVEGKANFQVEITTYRLESTYSDARRPDRVEFTTSIEEDLARRDLTINAMAWHPRRGLQDPYGGQADLKAELLRAVGAPEERFEEDALRILRTLRFAAELGFKIEEATDRSLREKQERLKLIAVERLQVEFFRLITAAYAPRVLDKYWQVIAVFLPEFNKFADSALRTKYLPQLASLPPLPAERLAYLVAVFYLHGDVGAPVKRTGLPAASLCRDLKCSKKLSDEIFVLSKYSARSIQADRVSVDAARQELDSVGRSFKEILEIKRLLGRTREEELKEMEQIDQELSAAGLLGIKSLTLDGRDLLELGFKGEAIGEALNKLYTAVLCESLANEKDALLERAESYRRSGN